MTNTIEFLKKAREAGATHIGQYNCLFKIDGNSVYIADHEKGWELTTGKFRPLIKQIDFSPLDDYYADKALDIRATGVGE